MTIGDFSKQADAYERARPSYPDELLDSLVSDLSIEQGDPVVDIGAGTGIFTKLLVDRGFEVTAVEPNEEMMRRAEVPEARWIQGTFEDNTVPSESQSWAVAAQAFHWADPSIHRVATSAENFATAMCLYCALERSSQSRQRNLAMDHCRDQPPCTRF